MTPKTAAGIAIEAIAESAYQLAEMQEQGRLDGIEAALAILRAIADIGGSKARSEIAAELAAYSIPFAALQLSEGDHW